MRRRDFIKGIVGSATAWPLVARARQGEHMRRIGVLMARSATDPEGQAFVAAFLQGLQELGWSDGRNAIVDIRWFTAIAPMLGNTRRNWSHLRRTSSWHTAARLLRNASGRFSRSFHSGRTWPVCRYPNTSSLG
jgi:hypothetical protein